MLNVSTEKVIFLVITGSRGVVKMGGKGAF